MTDQPQTTKIDLEPGWLLRETATAKALWQARLLREPGVLAPLVVVRLIDKATLETRRAAIARVKRSGIFALKGQTS